MRLRKLFLPSKPCKISKNYTPLDYEEFFKTIKHLYQEDFDTFV